MSQEQKFQNYPYILTSRGLVARFVDDRLPQQTYMNLKNVEVREENAISVRFGRIPLTVNGNANNPLVGAVNTLGRLKSLGSATYRYASAGTNLYRRFGDTPGVWSVIHGGLSGQRCSMVTYSPPFSSYPYLYIADANFMLQDNGVGNIGMWGILWPPKPMEGFEQDAAQAFVTFETPADFTFVGATDSVISLVNTTGTGTLAASTFSQSTVASATNIVQGRFIHIAGGNAIMVQYVDTTDEIIYFQSKGFESYTYTVTASSIEVVTNASTSSVEGTVSWNLAPSTNVTGLQLVLRLNVHNPTDLTNLQVSLSSGDATFTNGFRSQLYPGSGFVVNGESVISIPLANLTAFGTNPSLSTIDAIKITTNQTSAVTMDLYSMALDFGQGPSTFAGIPYSYLYTYFNANTGDESGPSPLMSNGASLTGYQPVSLFYGPVFLQWLASPDPRVTHVNIYRLGGTLANNYNMVAQIPVGTTQMYDWMPDNVATTGSVLNIDNYPPITSTLPAPVNTTVTIALSTVLAALTTIYIASIANVSVNQRVQIGSGQSQETVVVQTFGTDPTNGPYITCYPEFTHAVGETVYAEAAWAQACAGAQVAFDRLFCYGDKNNPGRLYFSNVGTPSCFGVENFIDMDDPSDPIMGMTPAAYGRAYVFTLGGAVYEIISVNGSIPVQTRTNATHGMSSLNAYTILDQGIPYLSNDGVYLFNGGTSTEASQLLQWVFREYSEAAGPVPVMDLTQRSQVCFGFYWDESFIAYQATDGNHYRVIYSARDNRWRNDDIPATAMNYEKDTATLIYGDINGMVYQDRTGNVDQISPTETAPINFELTTAQLDQGKPKNPKVYTELTVDIDTNGQQVVVKLLAGFNQTVVGPFVVSTPSREQVNFKVNNGLGFSAINCGFDVSGSVEDNVDIFELHLKALIDAELRQSFDTYWTHWGSNQWKTAKQGYFEYTCSQDITVAVYQEGNYVTPIFTFTLPSTPQIGGNRGDRQIAWIRFPATKAKNWRIVGVSNFDFQIYETSFIEAKILGVPKGYTPQPLVM